jgi:hypothetical protein
MARFCATNSPNTIDKAVASASPGRQANGLHAGADQLDDGRLSDVAGEQGGDRDTYLGAGELERQRVAGMLHISRSTIPDLLDVRVDSAAFHRGEGELGRDEDEGAPGQCN